MIVRQVLRLLINSPGGELLEALLVVRVVCVNVGTLDAGDADSSGLVETLDARCDLDTGLCGCADGASGDAEEGHCVYVSARIEEGGLSRRWTVLQGTKLQCQSHTRGRKCLARAP
jgi:hypothetical protein